ncbi:spermatogenesis-associated protein 7-like isoform X2 [Stegostoma tigrinum]|uniref:spermatogenesis-associated protein 7-like isoform X2 n=1 Tax=Stegostoma tigrinum TaxID=3053191 RepID=UPI00202B62C1|nr:spermatogenesis-associated protein 7-like isoform X2 [Stegostoma tigrinum]
MIPKHSLMGPFKGHMCIKSSPFCLGSSCKLSTQFIIQDHLAMHYKSLQSAKAIVDSSMPKSMSTSIKYKDQQKRERLNKAVKKHQKEILHYRSTSQMNYSSVSLATSRFRNKNLMKRPFQDPQKKTFSGDLLDKHSEWFTEERQAFTPRILKNRAKSFLLKYKYYTAPIKTQDNSNVTPTCNRISTDANIESFTEKSSVPFYLETNCPIWYQSQEMQKLNTRGLSGKGHSSTTVKSKLMAWILENIFQIHIERSKYHLNEEKLKNILQNLRHELQTDLSVSSSEYNAAAVQETLLLGKTFDRTRRPADKEPIRFKDDDKGKHDWRNSDLTENENIYP